MNQVRPSASVLIRVSRDNTHSLPVAPAPVQIVLIVLYNVLVLQDIWTSVSCNEGLKLSSNTANVSKSCFLKEVCDKSHTVGLFSPLQDSRSVVWI